MRVALSSLVTVQEMCMTTFSTSAPTVGEMSRSDQIHAANMADYASKLADFKASPTRTAASKIAHVTGTIGTLGMVLATPVVSTAVKGALAYSLTLGASTLCCIACCAGLNIAQVPTKPDPPDKAYRPGKSFEYGC